jgi:two-component system KDP operon response regulator KdpE
MSETVLLIDRDVRWQALLTRALEREGFSVLAARDGQEGVRKVYQRHPQAILLAVRADAMDGWTTCSRLRQVCDTPILILSATAREKDVVRGLALGADAFVTKPCSLGELSARIRALLRRRVRDRGDRQSSYDDGHLYVDLWSERVALGGEPVHLTPTELRLLIYLVSQRGRIVPHRELLAQVWGHECAAETDYLRVYIRYLRRKLQDEATRPRYICTRWRVGYYFSGEQASHRPGRPGAAHRPRRD